MKVPYSLFESMVGIGVWCTGSSWDDETIKILKMASVPLVSFTTRIIDKEVIKKELKPLIKYFKDLKPIEEASEEHRKAFTKKFGGKKFQNKKLEITMVGDNEGVDAGFELMWDMETPGASEHQGFYVTGSSPEIVAWWREKGYYPGLIPIETNDEDPIELSTLTDLIQ